MDTEITRTYREDVAEHVVTVDGREVATAHRLAAPYWSVKIGAKLLGIAPSEGAALLHLDRIADQFRTKLA